MNAFQVHMKFFTDTGLKDRAKNLQFKMLLRQRHPDTKKDDEISTFDKTLAMLILHNTKVDKIQDKYRTYWALRQKSKELGVDIK